MDGTRTRDVVDRLYSARLGVSLADLKPGQVAVAASERRTHAERGYGIVFLLWVMHFGNRAVVSVHPAGGSEVARLAWRAKAEDVLKDEFCEGACAAVRGALEEPDLRVGGLDVCFYHEGNAEVFQCDGEVRRATRADRDRWAGERRFTPAADHPSAARGDAFSLVISEGTVGDIVTHEPSVAEMANVIAEDGIEIAKPFRGRGYGKVLLSHWTQVMQDQGRVCLHSTSVGNEASVALARSVGHVEYARSRFVVWRASE